MILSCKKNKSIVSFALVLSYLLSFNTANAGDKLIATGGVAEVGGAGGGGLTPWALISGYGTDDQIGGSIFHTTARTSDAFRLNITGVTLGIKNKYELSLSRLNFGLGNTVPGQSIDLNTIGLKAKVYGDAVYDQESVWPQIAVGMQIKNNQDFTIPQALGAKHATGTDFYVAATKLYLDGLWGRNVLLNFTLTVTKANQFGILGFGGDKNGNYQIQPAGSMALMLRDNLIIGAEYRAKPDNLSVFKEEDAKDLFVVWIPTRNLSITAAYLDLGNIANQENQHGYWLSGQVSY